MALVRNVGSVDKVIRLVLGAAAVIWALVGGDSHRNGGHQLLPLVSDTGNQFVSFNQLATIDTKKGCKKKSCILFGFRAIQESLRLSISTWVGGTHRSHDLQRSA